MDGSAHAKDFLTTVTWVLIVAGAVLSIVGYVRLGAGYYSTEAPFDLAAIYAGFTIMLGGFAGFAIVWHSSRSKQPNDSSTKGGVPSFPTSES